MGEAGINDNSSRLAGKVMDHWVQKWGCSGWRATGLEFGISGDYYDLKAKNRPNFFLLEWNRKQTLHSWRVGPGVCCQGWVLALNLASTGLS